MATTSTQQLTKANTALKKAQTSETGLLNYINKTNQDFRGLLNRQDLQANEAFNLYKTTLEGQEKLPVLYERLSGELGIPELTGTVQGFKDQIYKVQQLLGNLDADLAARSKGTPTTQSQLNRLIAFEGAPLRSDLSNLGYALQPAADLLGSQSNLLGTMLGLNVQQQEKELQPYELQINMLSDKFAREITGYTTARQSKLDFYMDKLARNRTLADNEWQLAQQLAAEERDYAREQAKSKANISQYLQGSTNPTGTSKTSADWTSLLPGGTGINLAVQPTSSGNIFRSGGTSIPITRTTGFSGLQGGSGIRLQ